MKPVPKWKSMCLVARELFDIDFPEGAQVPEPFRRLPELHSGLFMVGEERQRCRDPEFRTACTAIQVELERRSPGSVIRFQDGGVIYRFGKHGDLRDRWMALHDAADERERAAQPRLNVLVKPGDWVKIGGRLLRVVSADPYSGMGFTERVGADGRVWSGQPTWMVDLQPCAPDDPTAEPWPEAPEHLTDALDRARFNRLMHQKWLEDARRDPPLILDGVPTFSK